MAFVKHTGCSLDVFRTRYLLYRQVIAVIKKLGNVLSAVQVEIADLKAIYAAEQVICLGVFR